MWPNDIQRKHFNEREAVVDEALKESMDHLVSANNHFGAAIQNRQLQDEFAEGIGRAQQVIAKLGTGL